MKIRISREHLLKGIQTVSPVIPTRSTLPILSHILLETRKGNLLLAGTDLELGISTIVPAETVEEGSITIPAKRFSDLIKELPSSGSLQLSTKKNQQVTIEAEKGVFKILGLPREEFPRLPHIDNPAAFTIDQEVLQAMLELTAFAVSKDESRYVVTGILFSIQDTRLRLVATDGHRLALIEREINSPHKGVHEVIAPFKVIAELRRLLGDGPVVKISIKENQIAFDLGETQLISRLIEGKFPNYESIIPSEVPGKLAVPKESLLVATKRISLWTTQESPFIRLEVRPDGLVISKQTPDVGEAHEEVKVSYSGPEFSVGFNPEYLIDVLKALPEGDVHFELPGPDRPGVIRTKDHYLYMVMPIVNP